MVKPIPAQHYFTLEGQAFKAPALEAGLYIVATPIGNLADITIRALQTLAAVDLIACEDTRTSKTLLDRYGIRGQLTPYHDHSGAEARRKLFASLEGGASIALISDAGTPLIADPGYKLVVEAREAGHTVVSIPGPSALTGALSIAGQPTDTATFAGFLPSKEMARRGAIARLKSIPGTICAYETAPRLAASLLDLADGLGADRPASVCREITKRFETVEVGTLESLAEHYAAQEKPRGEIVIVIGPAPHEVASQEVVDGALRKALETERVKDAASLVAEAYNLPKRALYQRALELAQDGQ
ncbi:MAG: 16S rRNA (cytidine(1402)-2'-O)-methyltransferase [Pseudomonadota bacterium]